VAEFDFDLICVQSKQVSWFFVCAIVLTIYLVGFAGHNAAAIVDYIASGIDFHVAHSSNSFIL
jgi:hypothetical protein